jgi:cyclophilin family peptidyl-prolyl cis-trans isomerase
MKHLAFLAIICLCFSCGKPVANFVYTTEKKDAPAKVIFENKSEQAETYEWDFGDGNFSGEDTPTHIYKSSGTELVTLRAKKGNKVKTTEQRILISAPLECLVEIETEYGNMIVKLYDATPKHRDNFIKLVEDGFYDDLLFHRVIGNFMVQGGDPTSKGADAKKPLGSGGPGYTTPAEFVDTLVHVKGSLCAARQSDQANPERRSSGSQFYLVHGKEVGEKDILAIESRKGIRYEKAQRDDYLKYGGTPFLDRDYVVFGRVIEGLDVIDKIADVPTFSGDRPKKDVKMKMRVIK